MTNDEVAKWQQIAKDWKEEAEKGHKRIAKLQQTLDAYIVEHDKALHVMRECAKELYGEGHRPPITAEELRPIIEKLRFKKEK